MPEKLSTDLSAGPLDLEALKAEVGAAMEKAPVMALATCAGGRVTVRGMSLIVHKGRLYFQTATNLLKYAQLTENPRVALCAGNLQLEGVAADLGAPLAPENAFFAEAYATRHPGSFRAYSGLPNNRVIEVRLTRATLWKYSPAGEPFRDFLDLETARAWREPYPTCWMEETE